MKVVCIVGKSWAHCFEAHVYRDNRLDFIVVFSVGLVGEFHDAASSSLE